MKTRFLMFVAFALLCVCACSAKNGIKGNKKVVTKEIPVDEYRSITLGGNFSWGVSGLWNLMFKGGGEEGTSTCHYSQQERATLSITTDENLFEYLSVDSKNGELKIQTKEGCRLLPTCFQITTGSKELEEVTIGGGKNFYLDTPLSGQSLRVRSSGGSDLFMQQPVRVESCQCESSGGSDVTFDDLICDRFACESSGGSDIYIKGRAEEAQMSASGGSDVKAYSFIVKNLACHASGGSDLYVYATEQLDAHASGGSDVHYKGPARVSKSASGGSDVEKED